jgi:serine/threonine-protein kinase RsbT
MDRFIVRRESDIGIAIVGAGAKARALGFSSDQIDRLSTAVSELSNNIIKYSSRSGGDIVIRDCKPVDGRLRLVVQARDNGPGINDIKLALQDHYSSGGTLGLGLPGVKRIVDAFSIISEPGVGTVVTIEIHKSIDA